MSIETSRGGITVLSDYGLGLIWICELWRHTMRINFVKMSLALKHCSVMINIQMSSIQDVETGVSEKKPVKDLFQQAII